MVDLGLRASSLVAEPTRAAARTRQLPGVLSAHVLLVALLGLAPLGCSATRSGEPPPRLTEAPHVPPVPGFLGGFRQIEAKGQGLELPLPDASGWGRDPRETQSWVVRHRLTDSKLVVRAWRHDAIASISACEAQARAWRPDLPERDPSRAVSTRQALLAGTYTSQIDVGIRPDASDGRDLIRGHVLAIGSDARSCLMLAFSTAASGPVSARAVAERLSLFSEGVFGRVRRLSIGARVVVPRL